MSMPTHCDNNTIDKYLGDIKVDLPNFILPFKFTPARTGRHKLLFRFSVIKWNTVLPFLQNDLKSSFP